MPTRTDRVDTAPGFVRKSLTTVSTRLLDLPSRYGLHLLIASRMPIDQVGAFYITYAVFTLASGFGRTGIDKTITREVATAMGRGLPETARQTIRRGTTLILLQSTAITVMLALLAKPIATYILHKPELAFPLIVSALTIVPQNAANAVAGALGGLNRVATSDMIYQWLWPGLFCIMAIVLPLNVTHALVFILVAMIINAAIGAVILLRVLPRRHPQRAPAAVAPLFQLSMSFFTLDLMQIATSAAPPFALGIVASTTEVGRYALAWRIVLALNLLVSAMGSIVSPQFAMAYAQGDRHWLRRTAGSAVGLTMALSALPMLLLVLDPTLFLKPFGAAYLPAVPTLRVLLIGQGAMILCTGVPELLGMTGHAKPLLRINVMCLITLVLGLAVFSPHFGDLGAAAATAITMIVNAIALTLAARRDLSLVPLAAFLHDARGRLRATLKPAEVANRSLAGNMVDLAAVEASVDSSPLI